MDNESGSTYKGRTGDVNWTTLGTVTAPSGATVPKAIWIDPPGTHPKAEKDTVPGSLLIGHNNDGRLGFLFSRDANGRSVMRDLAQGLTPEEKTWVDQALLDFQTQHTKKIAANAPRVMRENYGTGPVPPPDVSAFPAFTPVDQAISMHKDLFDNMARQGKNNRASMKNWAFNAAERKEIQDGLRHPHNVKAVEKMQYDLEAHGYNTLGLDCNGQLLPAHDQAMTMGPGGKVEGVDDIVGVETTKAAHYALGPDYKDPPQKRHSAAHGLRGEQAKRGAAAQNARTRVKTDAPAKPRANCPPVQAR